MTDTPTASTLQCYEEDWRHWCTWCEPQGIDPLHCTVNNVSDCFREWRAAGLTFSTIGRRKAAISHFQRQAGVEHPAVLDYKLRAVMSEIRRGAPPQRAKTAISHADLTRVYQNCDADPKPLRGLRDRAIFAMLWSGCLKRSTLAGLRVADLSDRRRLPGLSADARRMALEWLKQAKIVEGPLFRAIRLGGTISDEPLRGNDVARIVKRRCAEIGKATARFSAGSVRKGRVAHEIRRGTNVHAIMDIAGVCTVETVARASR